ncbi:MAG: alpha/beta hydrolase [Clostridia bacterium]|nr:alpha/beta hydrolase [Clostridia bacterium]
MEQTVMGIRVHCELAGQGSKRVVLLHGWGCSTSLMKPVSDALSPHMQVLMVDFPAHGLSDRPPEPWGVPEFAKCLYQLLEQMNFLPCSVVAHSFGCRVTLVMANEHPESFEKIVFTGGAGIKKPQTEEGKKRSAQFQKIKGIAATMKNMKVFGAIPEKIEASARKKYGSADYNALDEEMRKTFVKVISQDLTDCLPNIKQPTLLLWGDKDTETPLWMGQKMEQLIPDAGLVVLEGGTHFAYLEQLPRFNTIVKTFLMGA